MASETGINLLSRARVQATQLGIDANVSPVIDNLPGARAWLNSAIREVYRRKANDQKFVDDINVAHTIAIVSGVGTLPDTVMREFLAQAQVTDENDSLVSFMTYSTDTGASTFTQLGYCWVSGDNIEYKAPSPDLQTYSGDLYMTVPSFPTIPSSFDDPIEFPSSSTVDDVVSTLALTITGNEKFEVISA